MELVQRLDLRLTLSIGRVEFDIGFEKESGL
jgi:hypothetical protein